MKHCEKCLYYEKCKAEMDEAPDDIFTFFPYNEDCPHFKNKVDFVEVVRCKDCEYWNNGYCEGIPFCGDYASCILTEENDFCSYGKQKEGAE